MQRFLMASPGAFRQMHADGCLAETVGGNSPCCGGCLIVRGNPLDDTQPIYISYTYIYIFIYVSNTYKYIYVELIEFRLHLYMYIYIYIYIIIRVYISLAYIYIYIYAILYTHYIASWLLPSPVSESIFPRCWEAEGSWISTCSMCCCCSCWIEA